MQKSTCCPQCNITYGTRDLGRPHGPRVPLLLNCGHTFCEGCLTKVARANNNKLLCPRCQCLTPMKESLKELWPDIYMLGFLSANRNKALQEKDLKIGLAPPIKPPPQRTTAPFVVKEICEECGKSATCLCEKCEVRMCKPCFDEVHMKAKTLKRHLAKPLQPLGTMCRIHDTRPIEYFCETDQTPICSDCAIKGEHRSHEISTMEDKNQTAAAKLRPVLEVATNVLRRMKISEDVLRNLVPEARTASEKIVDNIRQHFHALHSTLQTREMLLVDELYHKCNSGMIPLEEMRNKVSEDISNLEIAIRDGSKVISGNSQILATLNVQMILDELNKAPTLPCAATKDPETEQVQPLKFEGDSEVKIQISKCCRISGQVKHNFSLKPLGELPDQLISDDDKSSVISSTCTNGVEADRSSVASDSCSLSSVSSSMQSIPSNKRTVRPTRAYSAKPELVYVSHIKSPNQFMVQSCEDFHALQGLLKKINKACTKANANSDVPSVITKGDIVCAKFSVDNKWYRAQVLEVTRDAQAPPGGSATLKVEVYFIDYGNTDIVTVDRLRNIKSAFVLDPAQAVACSLYDITPADERGRWSADATNEFSKMIDDRPVLMSVMKYSGDLCHVDLSKPPNDEIDDDRPVSIRDALVFLEYACFITPMSIPMTPGGTIPKPSKQYITPELPRIGDRIDTFLIHIVSPHSFFVQMISEEVRYLASLMNDLQQTYKRDTSDLYSIYCPQKEMVCVALYEKDSMWYRAKVVNLPGRRLVDIHYVDYGNNDRVPYWKLKKIMDSSLILPYQAVECMLADVSPMDDEDAWTPEAVAVMSAFVNQVCELKVVGVTDDGKLSVVLTTKSQKEDDAEDMMPSICINYHLVQEAVACSTGPGSEMQERQFSHRQGGYAGTRRNARGGHYIQPEPIQPPMRPTRGALRGTAQAVMASLRQKPPTPQQPVPEIEREPPQHEQVKVSYCVNPGKLYVQLDREQDNLLSMMNALQKNCQKLCSPSSCKWERDQFCAALYSQDRKWYRSHVDSINEEEETAQVRLVDYGYTDTVPFTHLRPLTIKQRDYSSFAQCCHLADIQPAGDITKWSQTAVEFLKDAIDKKTCFIVTKGDLEGPSQPVDLLIEEVIKGDALNADKTNYNSVTRMILNGGLALPKRRAPTKKGEHHSPPLLIVQADKKKNVPKSDTRSTTPSKINTVSPNIAAVFKFKSDSSSAGPSSRSDSGRSTPVARSAATTPTRPSKSIRVRSGSSRSPSKSPLHGGSGHTKHGSSSSASSPSASPQRPMSSTPTATASSESKLSLPRGPSLDLESSMVEKIVDQEQEVNKSSGSDTGRAEAGQPEEVTLTSDINDEVSADITEDFDGPQKAGDVILEESCSEDPLAATADQKAKTSPQVIIPDVITPLGFVPMSPVTPPVDHPAPPAPPRRHFYKPAELPTHKHIVVVPTYVDFDCHMFVQEVKPDDDPEGRFGYILKESSIEQKVQDGYLERMGLHRAMISRDGNCLFRAIAQALFQNQDLHQEVREKVVTLLREDWPLYEVVLAEADRDSYLQNLSRDGTYGGEPEIHVLCQAYNLQIKVYMGGLTHLIMCRTYGQFDGEEVFLSYVADGDYDSGHYDLVVHDLRHASASKELYDVWRQHQLTNLQLSEKETDNNLDVHSMLHLIRRYLEATYVNSKPEFGFLWEVGQPCVAQYSDDDKWYRANIVSLVEKQGVKVHHVDFGNEEVVTPDKLRSDIALEDIPIQSYECVLDKMLPNNVENKWSISALNDIHALVVSHTFSAVVKEIHSDEDQRILMVDMKSKDGTDLLDMLVMHGLARREGEEPLLLESEIKLIAENAKRDVLKIIEAEAEEISSESSSDEESPLPAEEESPLPAKEQTVMIGGYPERTVPSPYKAMTKCEPGAGLLVSSTHVVDPWQVYVQYMKQQNLTEINQQLDELISYSTEMNANYSQYPLLTTILPGEACCAQFSTDSCWYRAEVVTVGHGPDHDHYGVIFIDYGNHEYITSDRIRQLPPKFLKLPQQSLHVKLHGVENPAGEVWDNQVMLSLSNLFMNRNLLAVVCDNDDQALSVDLFDVEIYYNMGSSCPLVYQPLVDEGLLAMASKVNSSNTSTETPGDNDAAPESTADVPDRTENRSPNWADQVQAELGIEE